MGKDLRGREMGEGIMQRKDGRYSARFTSRRGRRVEKCFDTVADARKWYMRNKLQDEQEGEESLSRDLAAAESADRSAGDGAVRDHADQDQQKKQLGDGLDFGSRILKHGCILPIL